MHQKAFWNESVSMFLSVSVPPLGGTSFIYIEAEFGLSLSWKQLTCMHKWINLIIGVCGMRAFMLCCLFTFSIHCSEHLPNSLFWEGNGFATAGILMGPNLANPNHVNSDSCNAHTFHFVLPVWSSKWCSYFIIVTHLIIGFTS